MRTFLEVREMNKFKVKKQEWGSAWFVVKGGEDYLHSNGDVIPEHCEYWPTEEQAQAVLDKFRPPPPPHVWKHGDVFRYSSGAIMIYIQLDKGESLAYCLQSSAYRPRENYHPSGAGDQSYLFEEVEHLFNIKDKL
jgi:hypothetical protein